MVQHDTKITNIKGYFGSTESHAALSSISC